MISIENLQEPSYTRHSAGLVEIGHVLLMDMVLV